MKVTNDSLHELINKVDTAVESLLNMLKNQEHEIAKLKDENQRLRDDYDLVLNEVNQYTIQLEQIKSHYVNSNYNIK